MVDNEEAHDHLIQCEKGCLDICERITYFNPPDSIWNDYPIDEVYKQANYSLIQLTIASFDYPIFEETLKWSFLSFLGTIGGALGIWLGINVLDTITYIMAGVRFLIQVCRRRTAEETKEGLVFTIPCISQISA
jgi:Amiloride-sensitive sodium channel